MTKKLPAELHAEIATLRASLAAAEREVEVMRQARDLFRDQRDEAMKSMAAAERARDEAVAALREVLGVVACKCGTCQSAIARARAVLEGGE